MQPQKCIAAVGLGAVTGNSQLLQQPVAALCSETILLIQVSDFLRQISDVSTQLVVPERHRVLRTPEGEQTKEACTSNAETQRCKRSEVTEQTQLSKTDQDIFD